MTGAGPLRGRRLAFLRRVALRARFGAALRRTFLAVFAVFVDNPAYNVPLLANTRVGPFRDTAFDLVFNPTSGGRANATVTVLTDDPNNGIYTFAVTAEATGEPVEPTVGGVAIDPDGGGEVTIEGTPGQSYRLVQSTTLEPGSWTVVPGYSNIIATGSPQVLSLDGLIDPETNPVLFFRLEEN